ncbi:MAG TPA: GMC family oxidoreductase N-terminal domain-containing protein [Acidimicrobiia bacterium]|nr:GMC family oxidoreductase N-terminal domain-containing protein [Acidimicrobiia bacterium]
MLAPTGADYIVVGAGSAGCVLAARLSEDPATRVLLLEAGQPDKKQEIRIPAAFSKLFHTSFDWDYYTVPQRHLDDRVLFWPRGKTLGGTSSLNAMMWVRGVGADYDEWAKLGNQGWSYEEVLPYFKRAEDTERQNPHHLGRGGPMTVSDQRDPNPATALFVQACQRAGIPRNPNANVGTNEGVDLTQVSQRRGMRWSSADGYLRPAMKRPNLAVRTGVQATRVLVESGRAVGVEYLESGQVVIASAGTDVILAGGAINSPQLLMLSGIGPAAELSAVGVKPTVDLPGVGRNLMDHLAAGAIRFTNRTDSLVTAETLRELAKFVTRRKGMLTSSVAEAHAFVRSEPAIDWPDLEILFAPVPFLDHGDTTPPGHGYTIAAVLLQPASSGSISLASTDPTAAPRIDPNYLSEPEDLRVLTIGVERAMEIFETSPLSAVTGGWIRPDRKPESEAELVAGIRRYSETLYHPIGTCRMGVDKMAVVDPELRVHGVAGLRVADASIMPHLIRGHTNAPTVMIGEKAADLIKA